MSELRDKASELERRLAELEEFFDVEVLRGRAARLSKEMSRPGFWDDPEEAKRVSAEFSRADGRVRLLDDLRARLARPVPRTALRLLVRVLP